MTNYSFNSRRIFNSATLKASTLLALLLIAACSDDSESSKYQSAPPKITDIEITALDGQTVEAGKPLLATVVQNPIGKLLYQATYDWTLNPSAEYMKFSKGAIYDNEPTNPTDTFSVSKPGIYTIKFKATYKISGSNHQMWNGDISIPSGSVNYITSSLSYKVEATKTIRID